MHTDFIPVHVGAERWSVLSVREGLFSACAVVTVNPNAARAITVIIN
jgi:hypothetical protein